MTEIQLMKKIYEKYPATEKEKQGCLQEVMKMKVLRDRYKRELLGLPVKEKAKFE